MSFGLFSKGKGGSALFSDSVGSVVFQGKAFVEDYSITTFHDVGYFEAFGDVFSLTINDTAVRNVGGFTQFDRVSIEADAGTLTTEAETSLVTWNVFSFDSPQVYMHFKDPDDYGAQVIKITDSGLTGGPLGYKKWNIEILMFHPQTAGASAIAIGNVEMYCFSRVDTAHPDGTDSGFMVKDASGDTMYHSDFQPLRIQSDVSYGTRSGTITVADTTGFVTLTTVFQLGTINNAIVISIGGGGVLNVVNAQGDFTNGATLVQGSGLSVSSNITASSITEDLDANNLDILTGAGFGSVVKKAYLFKDFARINTVVSGFEFNLVYYSIDNSGLLASSETVPAKLNSLATPAFAANHLGASSTFIVVAEGADYDDFSTIAPVCAGGTIDNTESGFRYHIFKSGAVFTVATRGENATTGTIRMDVLVVGGGAGGATSGGGAGGFITGIMDMPVAGAYTVTVGAGGAGQPGDGVSARGGSGGDSTFLGMVAHGGGGGSGGNPANSAGWAGASGGGGGLNVIAHIPGAGLTGEGNNGGDGGGISTVGGGGGGAGASGGGSGGSLNGGPGGVGLLASFIATSVSAAQNIGDAAGNSFFSGGGGGNTHPSGSGTAAGGNGGGGAGGKTISPTVNAIAGDVNSGGGGGGGSNFGGSVGQNGGSGVVVVRYPI